MTINIHAERVPEGSYRVYIYTNGGSYEDRSPIDTVCLLSPYMDGVQVSFAKGELSDEINLAIARKAYGMGWEALYFQVPEGGKASRHAQYHHTDDGFDHYRADLAEIFG